MVDIGKAGTGFAHQFAAHVNFGRGAGVSPAISRNHRGESPARRRRHGERA